MCSDICPKGRTIDLKILRIIYFVNQIKFFFLSNTWGRLEIRVAKNTIKVTLMRKLEQEIYVRSPELLAILRVLLANRGDGLLL